MAGPRTAAAAVVVVVDAAAAVAVLAGRQIVAVLKVAVVEAVADAVVGVIVDLRAAWIQLKAIGLKVVPYCRHTLLCLHHDVCSKS